MDLIVCHLYCSLQLQSHLPKNKIPCSFELFMFIMKLNFFLSGSLFLSFFLKNNVIGIGLDLFINLFDLFKIETLTAFLYNLMNLPIP